MLSYKEVVKTLEKCLTTEQALSRIVGKRKYHYYSMMFQALKAYAKAVNTNQSPLITVKSVLIKSIASLTRTRPLSAGELNSVKRAAQCIVSILEHLEEPELKNLAIYLRLYNLMLRLGDNKRFKEMGLEL